MGTEEVPAGAKPRTQSSSQVLLNILSLILLFGLCFAVVLMPKYNYAHYASRLAALEAKAYSLETGFSKINILAGESEHRRAAILGRVDFIYDHLHSLESEALSFLENLATLSTSDLGKPRSARDSESGPIQVSSNGRRESDSKASPCWKVEDCISRYFSDSTPDPRTMPQMRFEDLLTELSNSRKRLADPSATGLPLELLEALFKTYKACVETINRNETIYTEVLVGEAIRSGNYVDITNPKVVTGEEEPKVVTPEDSRSLLHIAYLEDGRSVQFVFPYFDDPNYQKCEELRKRAFESFLTLLDVIMTTSFQRQ